MTTWKEYKLENVIKVKHGFAFKGAFFSKDPTNDILLSPGNFNIGGGFKSDKFKYYNGAYPESYILKEGDIIVTMTDLSKEGDTLGYSAKIPPHKGTKYLHNQRLGLLELIDNDFNLDFLYWLLRTREYQQFIVSSATGTTVKHTSPTRICEYVFKAPDYDTQTVIAEILSSLDDKIELNNKINQELENLAQTLFKQWFIDFEFPANLADSSLSGVEGYKSSGGEMVDSELGEIPKGWEVVFIKELGKIITGKTPSSKSPEDFGTKVPFITPTDFKNYGKIITNSIRSLSEIGAIRLKNNRIPQKSILVTCIGSDMGKVAINAVECITNQQINSLVLSEKFKQNCLEYLYQYFKSIYDLLKNMATGGSTMPIINKSAFEKIKIILPNQETLFLFAQVFEEINFKIETSILENQELTNLRDTLLPKLISGELEVEDL